MKRFFKKLKFTRKQLMESVLYAGILIGTFLIFVMSTLKDLPFVYSQF